MDCWAASDAGWQHPVSVQHAGFLRQQAQQGFANLRQTIDVLAEVRGIGRLAHVRTRRRECVLGGFNLLFSIGGLCRGCHGGSRQCLGLDRYGTGRFFWRSARLFLHRSGARRSHLWSRCRLCTGFAFLAGDELEQLIFA